MQRRLTLGWVLAFGAVTLAAPVALVTAQSHLPTLPEVKLSASALQLMGEVDERFQSYNLGFAPITGTREWVSYKKIGNQQLVRTQGDTANVGSTLYEDRPPYDLTSQRLINLTRALGPTYMRISGTQANLIYFQDDDKPRLAKAPAGFRDVLTDEAWRNALGFVKALDTKILTSFTISDGIRDAQGDWSSDQAERFVRFTKAAGVDFYAAELFNEPNLAKHGGGPVGYGAPEYTRDMVAFRRFVEKTIPTMKIVGPGDVVTNNYPVPGAPPAESLMATPPKPKFDIVSYHFYGAVSPRCAPANSPVGTSQDAALSEEWLARGDRAFAERKALRDRYAPGAPIWNTEYGSAACGGSPWSPTFLDSFRFVDSQGRLARAGLSVMFNQNLIGGENGIFDDEFRPRPNYWAALLWGKLMGSRVLDAGEIMPRLHLYAHCLRGRPGGVSVLAVNLDPIGRRIDVGAKSEIYAMTAQTLTSEQVLINGKTPVIEDDGTPRDLRPTRSSGSRISLAPSSITFIAVPEARNSSCGST